MFARASTQDFLPATPTESSRNINSQFALTGLGNGVQNAAGALIGVAAAVLLAGMTSHLPAAQVIHVLAALAASISVPMTLASVQDELGARAFLRAGIAVSAGFVAYFSLSSDWLLLGLAFALMTAWSVLGWIKDGANPLRTGLVSGLSAMALIVFSYI